jgi:hypothetical protein
MALTVLALVDLAWFLPLIELNGGLFHYLSIMKQFSAEFNTTTSIFSEGGWWGLARNVHKLVMYTLYGWGFALLSALLAIISSRRSTLSVRLLTQDMRFWFILLAIVPALSYYVFVHMGQQGLVFVFLPSLLLLSAAGLHYTYSMLNKSNTGGFQYLAFVGTLVVGNCLLFWSAPTFPLGGDRPKFLTVDSLNQHDAYYLNRFQAIRKNFPAAHTVLLSSAWRFPQYYLPEYRLLSYPVGSRWELGEGSPTLEKEIPVDSQGLGLSPDGEGSLHVVLFDADLIPFNRSSQRVEWLNLPDGQRLGSLRLAPEEHLILGPDAFQIVESASKTP